MQYNDNIKYNEPYVLYDGVFQVLAPGLSNPIVLSNVTLFLSQDQDYSNATTVAILSMDVNSNGIITVETTSDGLAALVGASTVIMYPDGIITVN